MFKRLIVEDWQRLLAIGSFTIFFACFLLNAIRVARLPRRAIARLENLPLSDDTDENAAR